LNLTSQKEFTMRMAMLLLALLGSPLLANGKIIDATLIWKPARASMELGLPSINLLHFQGKSILLAPFTDGRPDPGVIGENRENERQSPFPKVTTHDDVPKWVTAQGRTFFTNLGLPITDSASSRVIKGEILSFFVVEGNDYIGDVRIKILVEKDGQPVWSGLALGSAKRFGRSYKVDNYIETLSDSLQEAYASLLRNPSFLDALAN
jgi:hypothetical protein